MERSINLPPDISESLPYDKQTYVIYATNKLNHGVKIQRFKFYTVRV